MQVVELLKCSLLWVYFKYVITVFSYTGGELEVEQMNAYKGLQSTQMGKYALYEEFAHNYLGKRGRIGAVLKNEVKSGLADLCSVEYQKDLKPDDLF